MPYYFLGIYVYIYKGIRMYMLLQCYAWKTEVVNRVCEIVQFDTNAFKE